MKYNNLYRTGESSRYSKTTNAIFILNLVACGIFNDPAILRPKYIGLRFSLYNTLESSRLSAHYRDIF